VTYDDIAAVTEPILIAPMALTMSDDAADALAKYVERGGVLIADCRTGLFDERGWMRPDLPAGALRAAAGLVEGEQICSDPENDVVVPTADGTIDGEGRPDLPPMDPIHQGPPITFSHPVSAVVPAHGFLTPLELHGAERIARHDDLTLAARHDFGRGCVYYFGTYMGLALDRNLCGAHVIVQRILLQHAAPPLRGKALRPRLIVGKDRSLLAVFNDHRTQTVTEETSVPGGYRLARDVVTGVEYPLVDGRIELTVESENVVVLLLLPQ
jgi:hypothetical protein